MPSEYEQNVLVLSAHEKAAYPDPIQITGTMPYPFQIHKIHRHFAE